MAPIKLRAAAKLVGVNYSTVRMWILTHQLPAEKVDGIWWMDEGDVLTLNAKLLERSSKQRGPRGYLVHKPKPTKKVALDG